MPSSCSALGCKVGYGRSKIPSCISVHKFPLKNPSLLKLWLKNISRESFIPTNNSRICSLHFLPSEFLASSVDSNAWRQRKRGNKIVRKILKPGAVPTLFENFPKYLAPTSSTPRSEKATSASRLNMMEQQHSQSVAKFFEQECDHSLSDIEERLSKEKIAKGSKKCWLKHGALPTLSLPVKSHLVRLPKPRKEMLKSNESMDTPSLMNNPLSLFELFGDISFQLDVLHCSALIASLRQQQVSGQQCDFTIYVKGKGTESKGFSVHKCILAAVSDEIANTDSSVTGMELQADEMTVQKWIDFAYTGKIIDLHELSIESVVKIWEVAVFLKAASFRNYLLRARPDAMSRIVSVHGGVDNLEADNLTIVPINFHSSQSPPSISESLTTAGDRNDEEFMTLDYNSSSQALNNCIAEVCDTTVKQESNPEPNDSTFPTDYCTSNSESPSPVVFPTVVDTESTATTYPFCIPSKVKNVHQKTSKKKNSSNAPVSKKPVKNRKGAAISRSPTLVDKVVIAKTSVRHKRGTVGARAKSLKTDARASEEPQQKQTKPKLLENYEQNDIDLLKELKQLAPNASLWTVIPDLK